MVINAGQLTAAEVIAVTGIVVIIFGILIWHSRGTIRIRLPMVGTCTVPAASRAGQWIVVLGVLVLIATAIPLVSSSDHTTSAPPATTGPTAATPAVPSVSPSAPTPPSTSPSTPTGAYVQISPFEGTGPLSRDVVETGSVGLTRHSCYAAGWYVLDTAGWSAHYLKPVAVDAHGNFRTPELQMGSPDETGSSWWPFVLGGTSEGCGWLNQMVAQTPTGEYRQTWPPVGFTVLYSASAAVHRTT